MSIPARWLFWMTYCCLVNRAGLLPLWIPCPPHAWHPVKILVRDIKHSLSSPFPGSNVTGWSLMLHTIYSCIQVHPYQSLFFCVKRLSTIWTSYWCNMQAGLSGQVWSCWWPGVEWHCQTSHLDGSSYKQEYTVKSLIKVHQNVAQICQSSIFHTAC